MAYRTLALLLWLLVSATLVQAGADPMRPPLAHRSTQPQTQPIDHTAWRLNLIRRSGNSRQALLNGRLIGVGDRVDGALVTAIGDQQVTLRLPDARRLELRLPSAQLKRGGH